MSTTTGSGRRVPGNTTTPAGRGPGTDPDPSVPVGEVAPGFEPVAEEFAALLRETPGHAAQLAVHLRGERVVDLAGGPGIDRDSLLAVHSSTKGAAFLVVALLLADGTLDADREVRHWWPAFAAEGKDGVTLRDLLTHRAGAIGVEGGFTTEELAEDRIVAERVGAHRPWWRPGSAFGYHALTIGALVGEVVRRATGTTLHDLYEERIRAPRDLDFRLGLPAELDHRFLAPLPPPPVPGHPDDTGDTGGPGGVTADDGLAGIACNRNAPHAVPLELLPRERVIRASGPSSVGAVASARGLAGMYAAAVDGLDGHPPLLDRAGVLRVAQPQVMGHDVVVGGYRAHGLGFMVGSPFLGADSFGHDGAGGSMAFADPRSGLALGYTRRTLPRPAGAGPDAERLARAARRCALASAGAAEGAAPRGRGSVR